MNPAHPELLALIEQAVERRVAEPLRRIAAGDSSGLGPWGFSGHADQAFGPLSYAQFGEDLVALNLFRQIGIERPGFLDIGAHHPVNCSNTALFYSLGARGVNVEANPNLIPDLAEFRPGDVTVNVGVGVQEGMLDFYMIDDWSGRNSFDREGAEAFVRAHPQFAIREVRSIPVITLDQVVARHCAGRWPDFLSIDIEGLDVAVLAASSIDSKDGPRIICAEVVSGDDRSVAAPMQDLMRRRGYREVFRTLGNSMFVASQCRIGFGTDG